MLSRNQTERIKLVLRGAFFCQVLSNQVLMKFFIPFLLIASCFTTSLYAQCGGTFKVLHYTETTGFDHNTRNQSLSMFQSWATANNYLVVNDNDGSEFNSLANLQQFAVVVFSNTSGDNGLNATQRANFEAYIAAGGSYLGMHAASDTYRHSTANGNSTGTWDWYAETVAGASVQQNPNHTSQNHNNTMTHQQVGHPTLANVPSPWNKTEEYYYWENGYLSSQFTELLRVGSTGSNTRDDPRMMAHCRNLPGGGRSFYTALGHASSNYSSDQNFRELIKNALLWVAEPNVQAGSLAVSATLVADTCGRSTGKVALTISGGTAPYTYAWNTGATSQDISGLSAGTYSVTITDAEGCQATTDQTVPPLSSATTVGITVLQSIDCHGAATGELQANVVGGVVPFSYSWSNGVTSRRIALIPEGIYEVTVTDGWGCKATRSYQLGQPEPVTISHVQTPNSGGDQNPNGAILLTVVGGTPPFSYSWIGPGGFVGNGASPTGLIHGSYQVTVTDGNDCEESITVIVEEDLTASIGDQFFLRSLLIFPQPTSDKLTIEIELGSAAACEARILSLQGQSIWFAESNGGTKFSWNLSVETFPSGIYLLMLRADGEVLTRKLMIR